jgi:N-acetylglucosamine-6-phosphate deacetylase
VSNSTLITNVKIILPDRIFTGEVLVEEGKIASVGRNFQGGVPAVFDGGGCYLAPGFIDIHNHGRLGKNVMDGTEALDVIARDQLKHGVTGFLAGTSTRPWNEVIAAVRVIADYCFRPVPSASAQCFGIYSESNFFSNEKRGAHNPDWLLLPDEEKITELIDAAGSALKIAALSPELSGAPEAIRRFRSLGIGVSAAHSDAAYNEALAGINAGITLSTHTFNGMRSLHHQEPGILGAVLNDARVICEIIADGIHLSPAILSMVYKLKGPAGTALVSDSVELNGLPDGQYEAGGGRRVTLQNGAIRLPDGRLAGSCLNLDWAVRGMVELAGVPLWDAVAMASLSPARVLGLDGQKGSVEAGKDADLALLNENFEVTDVFVCGKHYNVIHNNNEEESC